jgi:hypothetical protein
MRRTAISAGLAILLLCISAFPQDRGGPKRAPSTPEERKRFVALVHRLEKTPLDENLDSETKWAMQWLDDVPDITVTICWAPLGHFPMERYRYEARIRGQFVLGMGAYQIEHGAKQADEIYLAGVESALKAYRAILKSKPDATSHSLDELQAMQDDGGLQKYVHDASKNCDGDKEMARGAAVRHSRRHASRLAPALPGCWG